MHSKPKAKTKKQNKIQHKYDFKPHKPSIFIHLSSLLLNAKC